MTGLDGDGPSDLATIDEGAEFAADILEYTAIGPDGELSVLAGDFRAVESDGARGIAADLEFARDEVIRDQQLIALMGYQFDNGSWHSSSFARRTRLARARLPEKRPKIKPQDGRDFGLHSGLVSL